MKHTRILFFIALIVGLGLMPGWELTSTAQSCQQEGACFVFESQGYSTDPSTGQTTITFRVTNKCRNSVGYVAIGTEGFTRVAPANGSVYTGDLGPYNVSWTRVSGNPGFESIKFAATLKNFTNFASDTFRIVVSNFNPATMIMVQGKSESAQETDSFLLSETCGAPTPTPTPTRHVYWANINTGTIGRADVDGQNVNQSFITGAAYPYGVAVDRNHVYWTNTNISTIGRADLDGQNVNQNFITGAVNPTAVAVDGSHVYWTNLNANSIGRADLDGQNVNQSFITGVFFAYGLTVDGSHVYWTNCRNALGDPGTIGRADLDGQNVNQSFITGNYPRGVTVDGSHVYWTDVNTDTIDRADLDGSNVNQGFIGGATSPSGVTVDSTHIYWTNYLGDTIGRADGDGQNVNQSFVTGASGVFGVAVDPE